MKLKAVFLDKDGSIIPDTSRNSGVSKVMLSEVVVEGLQMLQSYGYLLVMVSNQAVPDQHYFSVEQLNASEEGLYASCSKLGIYLDGIYYCPHHSDGGSERDADCDCRKLLPDLLLRAAHDKDIDLSNSWMIGDVLHDVEAGNRAGCKAILINNGPETEWKPGEDRMPEYFARDLSEAAKYIVAATNMKRIRKEWKEKYTINQT